MEEERHEVYERIPWETLEKKGTDRRWLAYAVAGAVVVGALGYTFIQNRPLPLPETVPTAVEQAVVPTASSTLGEVPIAPLPTTASPLVIAEADLYAVDPERLIDRAAAHAEWFAVEYFGVDGSVESSQTLAGLMPEGIPLPQAPEGIQIFVDWVGATTVYEVDVVSFDVEVAVRSMRSDGGGAFVRQPTRIATLRVQIGEDGLPRVLTPPMVATATTLTSSQLELVPVPDEMRIQLEASHGPVIGGQTNADGEWRVVVMATDVDGVARPTTIVVP